MIELETGWNLPTAMSLSNYVFRIDRRKTQYDVIGDGPPIVVDMHQVDVLKDRTDSAPDNLVMTADGFIIMLSDSDYTSFGNTKWLHDEFAASWVNAADFSMEYLYVFAGYDDCMRMLEEYRQADMATRFPGDLLTGDSGWCKLGTLESMGDKE